MKRISLNDWLAIGAALFGDDRRLWRFKCAACGHVQSAASMMERKPDLDPGTAQRAAVGSCEGRFHPAPPPKRRTKKPRPKTLIGCDWSLGGLLQIHQLEVLHPDSQSFVPVFMFDHPDAEREIDAHLLPPRVYQTTEATTWADWEWPGWVPSEVRQQIQDFWNERWRRGPKEWLEDAARRNAPPNGAEVKMRTLGDNMADGRFVFTWNNMGRVVAPDGNYKVVSF